jgi:uncharacterized protein (UPF0332 family)
MDWEECKKRGVVREGTASKEQIGSLIKNSERKLVSCDKLPMERDTASSKVSLMYDSLRILLEVFALKKGYKIYNHECFTSFLGEVLKEQKISEKFDKYRMVRNNLNYYGENIEEDDADEMIKDLKNIRDNVLDKYFGGDK